MPMTPRPHPVPGDALLVQCHALARRSGLVHGTLEDLPVDAPEALALIARGEAEGLGALDPALCPPTDTEDDWTLTEVAALLRALEPASLEHVAAAVVLQRPGNRLAGRTAEYIERRQGREPVEALSPWLAEVLGPTYGLALYGEQQLELLELLIGVSRGAAQTIRHRVLTGGGWQSALLGESSDTTPPIVTEPLDGTRLYEATEDDRVALERELWPTNLGCWRPRPHAVACAVVACRLGYLKLRAPAEFAAAYQEATASA